MISSSTFASYRAERSYYIEVLEHTKQSKELLFRIELCI